LPTCAGYGTHPPGHGGEEIIIGYANTELISRLGLTATHPPPPPHPSDIAQGAEMIKRYGK